MGFIQQVFRRRSKGGATTTTMKIIKEASSRKKELDTSREANRDSSYLIQAEVEERDDVVAEDYRRLRFSQVGGQLSIIIEEATLASRASSHGGDSYQCNPPMFISPPPAREAAFSGPPRFRWMDIETTAAIKLQSIYRRNKVMDMMEKKGISTSAIRNRKRRRYAAANRSRSMIFASEDAPNLFACCAMGLAFGDVAEEDDDAYRRFQNEQYEERIKQQELREMSVRKRYMRERRAGITGKVVEEIEVVD